MKSRIEIGDFEIEVTYNRLKPYAGDSIDPPEDAKTEVEVVVILLEDGKSLDIGELLSELNAWDSLVELLEANVNVDDIDEDASGPREE